VLVESVRETYSDGMRQSSVVTPVETVDAAANARGLMARARKGAADLQNVYGGSHSYWSRRLTGVQPMTASDIESVALLLRIHPAELFGGQAPQGWTPPECAARDSNPEPADYVPIRHLHAVA
jgi:hypothetical protein